MKKGLNLPPWSSIPGSPPQSSAELPSLLAFPRFAPSTRAGITLQKGPPEARK
jgi:hypothetical protein